MVVRNLAFEIVAPAGMALGAVGVVRRGTSCTRHSVLVGAFGAAAARGTPARCELRHLGAGTSSPTSAGAVIVLFLFGIMLAARHLCPRPRHDEQQPAVLGARCRRGCSRWCSVGPWIDALREEAPRHQLRSSASIHGSKSWGCCWPRSIGAVVPWHKGGVLPRSVPPAGACLFTTDLFQHRGPTRARVDERQLSCSTAVDINIITFSAYTIRWPAGWYCVLTMRPAAEGGVGHRNGVAHHLPATCTAPSLDDVDGVRGWSGPDQR